MEWFIKAFKQYATFSGRAQRSEYWFYTLFYCVFYLAVNMADFAIVVASNGQVILYLAVIYSLIMLLPTWAVSVRRLHDTNRSGWWILIGLIPLVGAIVLLVFFVQDSQPNANQYGANPKLSA